MKVPASGESASGVGTEGALINLPQLFELLNSTHLVKTKFLQKEL